MDTGSYLITLVMTLISSDACFRHTTHKSINLLYIPDKIIILKLDHSFWALCFFCQCWIKLAYCSLCVCSCLSHLVIFIFCIIFSQIDTSPQKQSVSSFEDNSDLTVQLHQTLADLETNLAGEGECQKATVQLKLISVFKEAALQSSCICLTNNHSFA